MVHHASLPPRPADRSHRRGDQGRAALVVAHPGHELRIHHWIERERPVVCVLTLGDGADRASRLPSTTDVLDRAGATRGPVYGRWRDRDVYAMLLARRHDDFIAAADAIATTLLDVGVSRVVADAEERYNPSHDVCRYLVEAAVQKCRCLGRAVDDCEFPLVATPDALIDEAARDGRAVSLRLDEAALDRKLAAAHAYPEMAVEVAAALARWGREAFACEVLTPARRSDMHAAEPPYYEQYGARQVAAGVYREVLRYDDHVRPLREALAAWAGAPSRPAAHA